MSLILGMTTRSWALFFCVFKTWTREKKVLKEFKTKYKTSNIAVCSPSIYYPMASLGQYLIKPKWNTPTMYDDSVAVQKFSRDIAIYSSLAGQIVKVAWLVFYLHYSFDVFWNCARPSYNRIKIKPSDIKDWLWVRGLHWVCFCGMATPSNVHLSSRIIQSGGGDLFVLYVMMKSHSVNSFVSGPYTPRPASDTNSL